MHKKPNIDRLIQGVRAISQDRRSLSDEEIKTLEECIGLLEGLKQKKPKAKKKIDFLKAIEILLKFFGEDIHNLLDKLG